MTQLKINASQPIVDDDSTMSQLFRQWTIQVSNNLPIIGIGSPEGSIAAPQYSLYIDETVPLTPVQYRKMMPSLTGDRKKGWAAL